MTNEATRGRWKPYPAYKPSGVEWLGDIPAHWNIRRLKTLVSFVTSGSRGWAQYYSDDGALFIRIGNLTRTSINLDLSDIEHVVPPQGAEVERTRVRKDDVLISVTAYIGSVAVVTEDIEEAYVNQHIALTRPRTDEVDSRWLGYCLLSRVGQSQFRSLLYGGTKEGLGLGDVTNLMVIVPALDEQKCITAHLDRETAKLDALIAKHERLIELLQEKRTALISHAVTKGLDPSAPMKDSGVPWLGQIPAHWETLLLKRIASIRYGLGQPPPEVTDGVALIRATNIKSGRISNDGMIWIDPNEVPESRSAFLAEGEIIVVRSGAYTGDSARVPAEYSGALAGYDMVVIIRRGVSSFFAWQFLCPTVRDIQFIPSSLRAAQPHLNAEELAETVVIVPPIPEQQAIAVYLDCETAKLDALIAKIRASIGTLREYRAALISAAVTGKVDVRGLL